MVGILPHKMQRVQLEKDLIWKVYSWYPLISSNAEYNVKKRVREREWNKFPAPEAGWGVNGGQEGIWEGEKKIVDVGDEKCALMAET